MDRSRPDLQGAREGRPEGVRVALLGGFRVAVGARVIEEGDWRLSKAGILVAMLALAPGHRLHREQIMDRLWPELDPRAAANNFHRALHAARRTLDPASAADSHHLKLWGGQLTLCSDGPLLVDVEVFEREAASARRSGDPAAYRAAIELYAGDLLPGDRYDGWARGHRHELRRCYLQLRSELADLEEHAEPPASVEVRDPAGGTDGERAAALAPPSQPWGEGSGDTPGRHNLPGSQSSFVGRRRELVEVRRSLARTPLLTLTGAGGSGKTRLALEVARGVVGAYPGGVWLVELAPLSDPDLMPRAVAATLGVRERPDRPLLGTLADHLRAERTLLILDNCEHLIDAAASLTEGLLTVCPGLRVLATSREPLGIPGEALWPVPTLSVPRDRTLAAEELARCEAVQLFRERARSRLPGFEVTEGNAGAVASVCRKLDGIPLAIELAAACLGPLAVEQVAQRVDDSLGLLTGGARTVDPRHQTLRATLDWSHGLLGDGERELFRRLSVFVAGFTLAAAEKVCAGEGLREGDVLPLLSRLVDRSLLLATGLEGEPRYRMLSVVRQYAAERLRLSGEEGSLRNRHADFYLDLAQTAEPELTGAGQESWLDRLESELGNLRAAVGWSSEGSEEVGLRLSGALWRFCYLRGHYAQGRDWLEGTLARDGARETPSDAAARAKALMGAGVLALLRCEYDPAEERLGEGLALYEELGDERGVASILQVLGSVARERGMYERSEEYHEESLRLWRDLSDEYGVALSLNYLGFVLWLQGKYDRAREICAGTLEAFEKLGDAEGIVWARISLGSTALYEGDLPGAEAALREALLVSRRVGYREGVAWSLNQLGVAAYKNGDPDGAESLLRQSLAGHRHLGDRWRVASVLEGLAGTAAARDERHRAATLLGAARTLRETISAPIPPCERADRDRAAEAVDPAREAAFVEGRSMTTDEAIEFALSEGRTPEETSSRPEVALTRRQLEVALLVSRGLTNRQIASELAISENTVANHVAGILGKLDLPSRSRLAVWVTRRGLRGAW